MDVLIFVGEIMIIAAVRCKYNELGWKIILLLIHSVMCKYVNYSKLCVLVRV